MATDIVAYGLYKDRASFERAVDALRAAHFRNSDVSAILPDRDHTTKDLAHEINTKTPEGIAAGAGAGAAVGGVLGWLVGIGAIAIPGIGPLIAAGPVVAALAGAGAAGATGGLVGGLIGAGIPEIEAKRFAGRIRRNLGEELRIRRHQPRVIRTGPVPGSIDSTPRAGCDRGTSVHRRTPSGSSRRPPAHRPGTTP